MIILDNKLYFPPAEMADEEGLLAIGGDLSTERLLLAYRELSRWMDQMPFDGPGFSITHGTR